MCSNQNFIVSLKIVIVAVLFGASGFGVATANDVIHVDTTRVSQGAVENFDDFYSPAQQVRLRRELAEACKRAEATLDARIVGYSTEIPKAIRGRLTQIRVNCEIAPLDGPFNTIAQAGPDSILSLTRTTGTQTMNHTVTLQATVTFDMEDLGFLSFFNLMEVVATHEIMHALGFNGFVWGAMGLSGPVGGVGLNQYIGNPLLTGDGYGMTEYRRASGNSVAAFIPLEQSGAGSAGSHYATGDVVFDRLAIDGTQAVMLAAIGSVNPDDFYIPETTFAIFADVGYAVSGINGHLAAPPNAFATGRWPKIVGPGLDVFGSGGPLEAGLGYMRVSGQKFGVRSLTEPEGEGVKEVRNTDKTDPYRLRLHRWVETKK